MGRLGHRRPVDRRLPGESACLPTSRTAPGSTTRALVASSLARHLHLVGLLAYETFKNRDVIWRASILTSRRRAAPLRRSLPNDLTTNLDPLWMLEKDRMLIRAEARMNMRRTAGRPGESSTPVSDWRVTVFLSTVPIVRRIDPSPARPRLRARL